jgi:hypothetical protein
VANETFPTSLPGPVIDTIGYKPAFDNVIRSQMDGGMRKRRRCTKVPEVLTCTLALTSAQLQILLDFYEITLKQVRAFDWKDWRKPNDPQALATFTFRAYPAHAPWGDDHWLVGLELDQLTTFQGTYLTDLGITT